MKLRRIYHMLCGQLIGWTTAPAHDLPTERAPTCCMCGKWAKGQVFAVEVQ